MCLNTIWHVASIERHKACGLGLLSNSLGQKEHLEWGHLLVCVKELNTAVHNFLLHKILCTHGISLN